MTRILIMGLPGAGKTTLAKQLAQELNTVWLNADEIRAKFNDWDFSEEGRIRQSRRMRELADACTARKVIADFVAPLAEMREIFAADFTIWMDTIESGRFDDTNRLFDAPNHWDIKIVNYDYDVGNIAEKIKKAVMKD